MSTQQLVLSSLATLESISQSKRQSMPFAMIYSISILNHGDIFLFQSVFINNFSVSFGSHSVALCLHKAMSGFILPGKKNIQYRTSPLET